MAEKKPSPIMGQKEYLELDELCRANPRIFGMDASPGADELEAFSLVFLQKDFVRGLLEYGDLGKAIARLENAMPPGTKTIPQLLPEEQAEKLTAQKSLERRIRFIHRVAAVLGPCDRPPALYLRKSEEQRRQNAAKALKKAHDQFARAMEDEYLKEYLQGENLLAQALDLRRNMLSASTWLKRADPLYPYERIIDEDGARAKILVNRLADACYRLYAICDVETLQFLVSYSWLRFVEDTVEIDEIRRQALERKMGRYNRYEPNEDYIGAGLTGEWLPAKTLDAPWFG